VCPSQSLVRNREVSLKKIEIWEMQKINGNIVVNRSFYRTCLNMLSFFVIINFIYVFLRIELGHSFPPKFG